MYQFTPDTLVVTPQNLMIGGSFDLGASKRFATIRVPLDLVLSGSIMEGLLLEQQRRARHVDEEWQQFLLWG